MLRVLCAALVAALAAAPVAGLAAAARERPAARAGKAAKGTGAKKRPAARPRPSQSRLERARAELASVRRDPQKRRFRDRWEKAITSLTKAARGKDRAPALLAAARGRYALYRFSQVESDRDEALRLAALARRSGAREAAAFAAAVRREAGDDRPARPARTARKAGRPVPRAAPPPEEKDEDGSLDEALAKALEDGDGDAARPQPRPFAPVPEGREAEGPVRVSEVRSWSRAGYTRVAVYLSRPATFHKLELPSDGDHPRRLAIDIPGAVLDGPAPSYRVGDELVEQVRTGQTDPQTVRVVLDLHGDEELEAVALADPPRLIVDVGGASERGAAPADGGRGAGELAVRRPIHRIIVDAGHGGHDSGAIGPTRVREKDVTLAVARRLARRLRSMGYEVLLTRNDDRYLALEERTAFANAHRGDLFVSIHANAHPRRDRRGTETFVLNVADDRYARRLAARENGALADDAPEGIEVRHILSDLDARWSTEASRRLARQVQRELVSGIRQEAGAVRDLGVKSALFYVLLGARMPAVLVETAFISNRAEERRLKDPRFQEAVAEAIARGVGSFARGEAPVAAR
ncbi:MAG TPA: N-acetylmuramoyl-L-alanine amidase [Anaeromyxobacteraceae bacterium]|nr:N-acetylmuramoyl-L-alanine amidase [Anaeromyxobacteraceae bacterium]